MKRIIKKLNLTYLFLSFILGLILGMVLISLPQSSSETKMADHSDAANMPHMHNSMKHEAIELLQEDAPSVELIVHEDPKSGWNLEIKTNRFEFSPQRASLNHSLGEGHAHLYIDDVKITRLYSNWFHIPELTSGEHVIKVTLNSNDHRDYTILGEKIQAIKTIVVE